MTDSKIKMSAQATADFFGITKDTLRFYEKKKIIPRVPRDKRGYRVYTNYELNWIYLILGLKKVGLPLSTIAELVELFKNPTEASLNKQKEIFHNHIKDIDKKIDNLNYIKEDLQNQLNTFDNHWVKYEKDNLDRWKTEPIWKNFKK